MTIEQTLSSLVIKAVKALYDIDAAPQQVQLQKTRPEFEGNITVVVFPFVKATRKAPAQVAAELGQWLVDNGQIVSTFNAVQGFLNLSISDAFWLEQLRDMAANKHYGDSTEKRGLMMVEYSSPNTNKPLHLRAQAPDI